MSDAPDAVTLTPLCLELAVSLRARFGAGLYRQGSYFPAEADIANEFGVSRGTLRKVLDHLIAEGDLARGTGGRVMLRRTEPPALAPGIEGCVYFWGFNPRNVDVKDIADGIERALARTGVVLRTGGAAYATTQRSEPQESAFLRTALDASDCRGVVVCRDHRSAPVGLYGAIADQGLPLVFCAEPPPVGYEADFVGTAHQQSADRAVAHAITLGHRNIVCMSHGQRSAAPVYERIAGYRAAMERWGLAEFVRVVEPRRQRPFSVEDIGTERENSPYDWVDEQTSLAEDLFDQVFEDGPRPTALFSAFDRSVDFARRVAHRRGIRVPEDLSLLAYAVHRPFGGSGLSEASGPVVDHKELGRQAGELLLARLSGREASALRQILLLPTLHEGDTLAPCGASQREPHRGLGEGSGSVPRCR